VLTAPLAVVAGIFGMSTSFVPLMNKPTGFWTVIGGMLALIVIMLLFFRHKKWI
jgi:magnesium transporter